MNSVYNKVYEKVKVGPEFILQLPPLAKDDVHDGKSQQHHGQIDKPDFHLLEDQARLKAKIEYEEQLEQNQQKVLPDLLFSPEKLILEQPNSKYFFIFQQSFSCGYYNGTSGYYDWTPETKKKIKLNFPYSSVST